MFIGIAVILLLEGAMLHRLITQSDEERCMGFFLGYPIGVFMNTLIFFFLHLFHIPFGSISIFGAHGVWMIMLFILLRKKGFALFRRFPLKQISFPTIPHHPLERIFLVLALVSIAVIFLLGFLSAVTLPMFYWDSFAHWALRAKVSLEAGSFVIDGVIQPQYPVLLHSLQMLFSPLGFYDQVVNTATFLLSFTTFLSIFYIVYRSRDLLSASLVLALLTGIPLVAIHLRQGMGDIHIVGYVLLSALLLDQALSSCNRSNLLLSAIFVAAASWTKYEGLYFGVLPWLMITVAHALRTRSIGDNIRYGIFPAIILTAPWPILTLVRGLNLSAHGGSFALHPEAIPFLVQQLFALGTFGIHWWAIFIIGVLLFSVEWRNPLRFLLDHPSILWGILSFILLLVVYLFTNEVRGLIHRDNFSRAMFLPTLLFTQAFTIECYRRFYIKLS